MEKITRNTNKNRQNTEITETNTAESNVENTTQPVEDIREIDASEVASVADDDVLSEQLSQETADDVTNHDVQVDKPARESKPRKRSSRKTVTVKSEYKVKSKYKFSLSKLVRNIIIIAVIILLSIGCFKGFSALVSFVSTNRTAETRSQEISITSTGTLAYERFQRGVIVANSGNIAYFNSKLECLWEMPGFDGLPVIHTNGRYALVAYTDTPNARLINGSDAVAVTGSGKIVSSYVNENGYFALVMTEDGYKNQISVFDNEGKLIYKWHSAENYITSVALSPDNKNLAAATIGFTENGFDSGIMMFDLAQNKPNSGKHQSDNLIMNIEFLSNSRLVAIGDKTTTYYKKDGKMLSNIDYNGKKLITFDVADSGRVILCFAKDDSAMSKCDVYSYKTNGKQAGHYETGGRVLSVSSCDSNVLVAGDSAFDLLTDRCRRIGNLSVVRDLKKSVLFNGGRDAFVISGNVAQVIRVK